MSEDEKSEWQKAVEHQRFIDRRLRDYRRANPETVKTFMDFWRQTKHKSAIPQKYKELIELALVIYGRCVPCIYQHTKLCLQAGATPEEIIYASMQAVAIGGAILYDYLAYVMETIENFKTKSSADENNKKVSAE